MPILDLDFLPIFISLIGAIIAYYKWSYGYWSRRRVPSLNPSIPFGDLENPIFLKHPVYIRMQHLYKELKSKGCKHGGLYSITRPIYMPVDLDFVRNVLVRDFQNFMDRGVYHNEKTDPITANLFSLEGQRWKSLRAKLTPTFTSGKMKTMFSTVLTCGHHLTKELGRCFNEGTPLDVKETAACFTTDVIGSAAFGLDCDSFNNPKSQFRQYGKKVFGKNLRRMTSDFLVLSFPKFCKYFGIRIFPEDITSFFMNVVADIVKYRENGGVTRNDFVQLLLEIKNKRNKEESITFQEMAAQAFIFFFAGFETSSTTMTFCLYELAQNKQIQDKLRSEIVDAVAKHGEINYDAIMEMKYMTQVIEETLRKYPALGVLNRVCVKEYKISDTYVTLDIGTKVFIPVYAIHHDPDIYPDPEIFNPENFSPENKAARHSMAFLPFGEGPRMCIGLRFGIMQAKIGLSLMLKDYKFTLNAKTPVPLTLNSKTVLISATENVLLDIVKI